jgi:hypothetical protein
MLSVASVRKGSILARDATAKRGAETVAGQLRRTGRSLAAQRTGVDVVLKARPKSKLKPSRLRTVHHLQLQHHRHSIPLPAHIFVAHAFTRSDRVVYYAIITAYSLH